MLHEAEELAGGVALEAAPDLGVGLLLGSPAGEVVAGAVVVEHPPVDDHVQGAVELAVCEPVQPVTGDLGASSAPLGGFSRARAG